MGDDAAVSPNAVSEKDAIIGSFFRHEYSWQHSSETTIYLTRFLRDVLIEFLLGPIVDDLSWPRNC
jgi:hypothetical protein